MQKLLAVSKNFMLETLKAFHRLLRAAETVMNIVCVMKFLHRTENDIRTLS